VPAQLSEASLLSCGFLVSSLGRRANDLLGTYFISTNPIHQGSMLMTSVPSKGPPPNAIIFGD